jgi:hypothetical protein
VESLASVNGKPVTGVSARIDWDIIERKETLDEIASTDAIKVENLESAAKAKSGTTITLKRLRKRWTKTEHGRFLEEAQTFQVPSPLLEPLPKTAVSQELLFKNRIAASSKQTLLRRCIFDTGGGSIAETARESRRFCPRFGVRTSRHPRANLN